MDSHFSLNINFEMSGYSNNDFEGFIISLMMEVEKVQHLQVDSKWYTHIGNSNGGSSGIDSSTTNYDSSTGVVEFNVSGSGVLTVDSDTLYVDNGNSSEGYYDQTMGVYLDMGLGLSSALIPSSNTVTSPEASIIVDSTQTTVNTLDGTVGDVNAMPWMIELTDYDDVFIGRDAVYDSATNSYDPEMRWS